MDWFTDRHFFLLAVILYGLSTVYSVFLWRKGFRRDDRVNYFLLLAAFVLHTMAMIMRGLTIAQLSGQQPLRGDDFSPLGDCRRVSRSLGLFPRLRFLGAFASPVLFAIGVFALMPSLDPPHGPEPEFSGALISLHAATDFAVLRRVRPRARWPPECFSRSSMI